MIGEQATSYTLSVNIKSTIQNCTVDFYSVITDE